jgi:hypothetical protein
MESTQVDLGLRLRLAAAVPTAGVRGACVGLRWGQAAACQRLAMPGREHRIGGSVDDQGRHGDRGKRRALALVIGHEAVVAAGGDVAGAADVEPDEVPRSRLIEWPHPAGQDTHVADQVPGH